MRAHVLSMLILFTPAIAIAEDGMLSKAFASCLNATAGGDSDLRDCVITETEVQDRKLNANYKRLGALVTPARKQQLLAAQRLWIKYVAANYQLLEDPDGGTMARMQAAEWVMHATAERADELEDMAAILE